MSASVSVEPGRVDVLFDDDRPDPFQEAEAIARKHMAREEEVEKVGQLVRVLDDAVRVPGTKFGIGLDAVLGFIAPGVGDAVTGVASMAVLWTAMRRGVPRVVLLRMLANIAIDTVGGLVPVVGDVFDLMWRSNTRNMALLERHQGELEPRARKGDYLIVGGAMALIAAGVVAPFFLLGWVFSALFG